MTVSKRSNRQIRQKREGKGYIFAKECLEHRASVVSVHDLTAEFNVGLTLGWFVLSDWNVFGAVGCTGGEGNGFDLWWVVLFQDRLLWSEITFELLACILVKSCRWGYKEWEKVDVPALQEMFIVFLFSSKARDVIESRTAGCFAFAMASTSMLVFEDSMLLFVVLTGN